MKKLELPIIHFPTVNEWETWLKKHHTQTEGIWIKLAKKDKGVTSVSYLEGVLSALCYGWIDGQAKTFDNAYYLVKFTPRRAKSIWSKINVERVAQLIKDGKMQPAGQAQIDAAKADGRWDQAYDSPKNMVVPEDFLQELAKNAKALAFFETLNKSNTYAIAFRLQTAKKPETRERRKQVLLEMLKKGEKLY